MYCIVGRTRASSSGAERGVACGRVDCPPMSRMGIELVTREVRVGRREEGVKVWLCRPSEEKESGVRFRMAMMWVLRLGAVEDMRCTGEGSKGVVEGDVEGGWKRVSGVSGESGVGVGVSWES